MPLSYKSRRCDIVNRKVHKKTVAKRSGQTAESQNVGMQSSGTFDKSAQRMSYMFRKSNI